MEKKKKKKNNLVATLVPGASFPRIMKKTTQGREGGSVGKAVAMLAQGPPLDSQSPSENGKCGGLPVIPALRDGDRRIGGASLVSKSNLTDELPANERPFLKESRWMVSLRMTPKAVVQSLQTHMCRCTHMHTHMFTFRR